MDGKWYIDFAGGIGVLNVGHTPPSVIDAIHRQSEKLIHTCFSVAYYEPYLDLCERLVAATPGRFDRKAALFNSGAEAVENAVKMARAFTGRPAIVAFENAFHGRTMMAMTLTGKERPYREGFGPFAPDVHHARFPHGYRCDCKVHAAAVDNTPGSDSDATCPVENGDDLETVLERIGAANVAAVIVEPVQGEGGFVVAPTAWLRKVREICRREGILMIADEIQTGFGRTGAMFAVEHSGVEPDIILLAKSLAAGLPLSAVVGRAEVLDGPGPGGVGGTYGGNPVACAAAMAVLDIFEDEQLVEKGNRLGAAVAAHFSRLAEKHELVGEVRGLGRCKPWSWSSTVTRRSRRLARRPTSSMRVNLTGY